MKKYNCFLNELKTNITNFIDIYFIDENDVYVYNYLKFITDIKLKDTLQKMQLLCRIFLIQL